uniref:BED-type domain-containing protein n=1 Tax=Oryza rufipogon TaxID=4529 RepID=A0A0E0QQT4_ORYRU
MDDQECGGPSGGVGKQEDGEMNGTENEVDDADDMVEQEESSGSAPSPLLLGTRPKRLRSKVWDDFTPIFVDGKVARAECMHCHRVFNSGTSNLLKHQAKCSPRAQKRPMQQELPVSLSVENRSPKELDAVEQDIPTDKNTKNLEVEQAETNKLVRTLAMYGDIPLRVSNHGEFSRFVASLNPMVEIPPADNLYLYFTGLFEEEKAKLKKRLASLNSRVSLSVYVWHYDTLLPFLCLSVHYIDDQWQKDKKIIAFQAVDSSCHAKELSMVILTAIRDWGLFGKVFSIALDDAFIDDSVASDVKDILQKWNSLHADENLSGNQSLFVVRYATHLLDQIIQLFDKIWDVKKDLHREPVYYSDEESSYVREKMQRKFKEQWKFNCLHICMPMIMDPKYRLEIIKSRIMYNFNSDMEDYIEEVNDMLLRLFREYSGQTEDPNCTSSFITSGWNYLYKDDRLLDHYHYSEFPERKRPMTEFDQYLEDPCLSNDGTSVLKWWKEHSMIYPTIARIARDILAIPYRTDCKVATRTTRVAIAKSDGNHYVEERVCTQDWLRSGGLQDSTMRVLRFRNVEDNMLSSFGNYVQPNRSLTTQILVQHDAVRKEQRLNYSKSTQVQNWSSSASLLGRTKMVKWALGFQAWAPWKSGAQTKREEKSSLPKRVAAAAEVAARNPALRPGIGMEQDCDDAANQVGAGEERILNVVLLKTCVKHNFIGMGDNVDNANDMAEQEESSGSAPSPLFLGTRPKRLRSKAWDDFTPIYIDGKVAKAECMHCHQVFVSNSTSGTSSLLKHQSKCNPHAQKRAMQQKLPFLPSSQKNLTTLNSDPRQKKLLFLPISQKKCSDTADVMPHKKDPALPNSMNDTNRKSQEVDKSGSREELATPEQKNLTLRHVPTNNNDQSHDEHPVPEQKNNPTGTNMKNPETDQNGSNGLIQTMAMCGYLPLMMHNDRFRKCLPCFDSMVNMPANINIYLDFIQLFDKEKAKLKERFAALSSRVCLSAHVWHYVQQLAFLCLSVHYIDEEWERQQKIIRFCHVGPSCDAGELSSVILGAIEKWGLRDKLLQMSKPISRNGIFTVQNRASRNRIHTAKQSLFVIRYGTHLLDQVIQVGLDELDKIMEKSVMCSKFMEGLTSSAVKYSNNNYAASGKDWTCARRICDTLEDFHRCIDIMPNFPCPVDLFYMVWKVKRDLQREVDNNRDDSFSTVVKKMQEKFKNCWKLCCLHFYLAMVVDPSHRLEHIKFRVRLHTDTDYIHYMHDIFLNLFDEYSGKVEDTNCTSETRTEVGVDGGDDRLKYYRRYENPICERPMTELDQYLQEPRLSGGERDDWLTSDGFKYDKIRWTGYPMLAIVMVAVGLMFTASFCKEWEIMLIMPITWMNKRKSSGSAPSPLFLGTRPKRLRSKVWDDFKPIYIDGKVARAECMHCHQILISNSANGTSNLLKHQAKCSPIPRKGQCNRNFRFCYPARRV